MMLLVLLLSACPELPKYDAINCAYEQKKKSPLFKKEITSKGTLWVKGKKLRFDTSSSSLVVNGNEVTMRSGGKTDKIPLSAAPKVEAFLGTFSELFVGKVDTKDFNVSNECSKLVLTPKAEAPVKKLVIHTDGKKIELVEQSGDEIVLTLSQCKLEVDDAVFQ